MTRTIIPATPADYKNVLALLECNQLPTADISESLDHFFVIKQNNAIAAVIGLEYFNETALLRSMATAIAHRGKGLAGSLVTALEKYAVTKEIKSMYLLTTTASQYFQKKGYSIIDRDAVPQSIQHSTEFSALCPASAIVMKKDL